MAYATSNQPSVIAQVTGNSLWYYNDDDAVATVEGADYFSDGDALGMQVGDIIIGYDSTNALAYIGLITAVTAGGAATMGVRQAIAT